jgi:hypothetical protein
MSDPHERRSKTSILRLRGTVLCGSVWMLVAMAGDYSAPFAAEGMVPPQAAVDDAAPAKADAAIAESPARR